VSQHLRSLELAFRVPLLTRINGRMVPTEAGEILLRHGTEILARMDAIQSGIDGLKNLSGGRVAVGASNTAGSYVLPKIITRFRRQYPEVQIVLHVERAHAIHEHVLRGAVDFAVTVRHGPLSGVVVEPLYRDRMVLVASPEHPVARRSNGPLALSDLARLPLVSLDQTSLTRQLCDDWFTSVGIWPPIEIEFDSIPVIKRVIAEGVGAGLLYYSTVLAEVAIGQLKIIEVDAPPLHAEYVLLRRSQERLSPAARELIRALVRDLADYSHLSYVNQQAAQHFLGGAVGSAVGLTAL
jgi:LysR family transcriptional regulator for metE and metH